MSKFKPLRNICLCELLPQDEESILDLSQLSTRTGVAMKAKVVVAGLGRTSNEGVFIPNEVKEGNIVYFSSVHESSAYGLDENQVLVAEHNILAIEE